MKVWTALNWLRIVPLMGFCDDYVQVNNYEYLQICGIGPGMLDQLNMNDAKFEKAVFEYLNNSDFELECQSFANEVAMTLIQIVQQMRMKVI